MYPGYWSIFIIKASFVQPSRKRTFLKSSSIVFTVNAEHVSQLFLVSAIDFAQVDTCWIPISEKTAHKKDCNPKYLYLKTFFICSLLCLIAGSSFFQSAVFLNFTKVVVDIRSSVNTVFVLEEQFQPWIAFIRYIWQILLFKTYCNFWRTLAVTHLSSTHEATCNDLVFSRVLCFFETNTCNHPFFQRY